MTEASSEAGGTTRRRRLALAVFALLPPLVLLAAEGYVFGDVAGFPLDDSWIHFEFARHLAHGDGLVYDAGRFVAGSTAPLWTAVLAALFALPGPVTLWAKLAGIAAQVASVDVGFRLARRLGLSPARATLAAVLIALSDWLVWSSISGMEVNLFTLLSLAGILRHLEERDEARRPPLSFLWFALAALARPEGLLLIALAALDGALEATSGDGLRIAADRLRRVALGLLLAALVLVPIGAAYAWMSGSPLPTTLGAKSSGPPRFVPELRFLRTIFGILFPSQPLPALLAAGGAAVALRRLGGPRDRGLLLPLWAFGLPVAAAMLSSGEELLVGNFGRYFFPLLPPLVLLGMLALEGVSFRRLRSVSLGRVRLPLGAALLAALLLPPLVGTLRTGALYLRARANVEDTDGAAARWIGEHLPADALLAVCDIGLIKYRLPNPIVDLAGIVSPDRKAFLDRARREQGLPWPNALRLWLEQKRPDYVVVYPEWFPLLEAEPASFPVLHRIKIPDNVAMAGDELVVYATPWTRKPASAKP